MSAILLKKQCLCGTWITAIQNEPPSVCEGIVLLLPLRQLRYPYIPLGKVTLPDGDSGLGKSYINRRDLLGMGLKSLSLYFGFQSWRNLAKNC